MGGVKGPTPTADRVKNQFFKHPLKDFQLLKKYLIEYFLLLTPLILNRQAV